MPGKYLEYIKAGRYVVPVELTFLPAKLGEEVTSKWVERRHWKEVKALLKPAVELVSKYNEGITERVSKSHHVAFGHEVALGYLIQPNKDKSPFLAVLDPKKNCWTEDEEEMEVDENSGLGDFGGRHKSFMPTKSFVKVCVLKKTASQAEDGKKLRKELGVKSDDVRNYFSSGSESAALTAWNTSMVGGGSSPQKQHKPKTKRKVSKKTSHRSRKEKEFSSSEESLMDLPPPGTGTRNMTPSPQRFLRTTENVVLPERDRTDALEMDDDSLLDNIIPDSEIFSDSVDDVFSSSSLFRNWIEDDDEDFDEELPDIEETGSCPVKKKKSGSRRKTGHSPVKTSSTGLPDIDDPNKRSKPKKKRNVAIVEPMKPAAHTSPVTTEESRPNATVQGSASTERKKKPRGTASPTIERLLNSRSRQSNPAIEIVSEDFELPLSDSHSSASKQSKGRKRQRMTKKRLNTTTSNIRTPSPFPETEDGHLASGESDSSDSDMEMPVLTKMVPSPNNEAFTVFPPGSPPDTIPPLEPQAELPSSSSNVFQTRPERRRRSPSPDIVEQYSLSSTVAQRKRTRAASDSDDITSESAYRKTPFRRKKKRKRSVAMADYDAFGFTPIPDELEASVPGDISDDLHSMATQTIPPPSQDEDEERECALTQPLTETVVRVPSSSPIPSTSKSFNLFSIKKERVESTEAQSDSDRVPSSEEEEDEDVLFAGQYQAIPIVTLDASPRRHDLEDDSEEELFSFTRPSIKMEPNSQSRIESPFSAVRTNRAQQPVEGLSQENSSTNPQSENDPAQTDEEEGSDTHDDDYAFNFVEKSVRSQKRSTNFITPQTNPFSDTPPEPHSQSPMEENSENSVQSLSTFQLINHPGTLQAGFGFLNKVMSKNGAPNSVLKHLRLGKNKKKSPQNEKSPSPTDADLMPPPPSVRPVSPDICSLGPEERRRSKPETARYDGTADSEPIPGTSSGRPSSPFRLLDDLGNARDDQESDAVEPFFREYMNRRQQQSDVEYQPLGDEYDLTQSSQCMLSVVPDYAAKSRQYKKHTKNIEKLTAEQFRQCFEVIKPDLLKIFEGTETSHRNQLYCNRRHHDIRTLKSLYVNRPFNAQHGNSLNGWLYDLLVPYSGSTLKTADYVNYVMRPEAFIRIYALVNKISRETAEKEMMAGPCYDGPYLER